MFAFSSKIVSGKHRGRLIGFPTLNFDASRVPRALSYGVYHCEVWISEKQYPGIAHFGPLPTFNEKKPTCEVYLFQYHQNIKNAKTGFVRMFEKIRDIKKFKSINELKLAVKNDIASAHF